MLASYLVKVPVSHWSRSGQIQNLQAFQGSRTNSFIMLSINMVIYTLDEDVRSLEADMIAEKEYLLQMKNELGLNSL